MLIINMSFVQDMLELDDEEKYEMVLQSLVAMVNNGEYRAVGEVLATQYTSTMGKQLLVDFRRRTDIHPGLPLGVYFFETRKIGGLASLLSNSFTEEDIYRIFQNYTKMDKDAISETEDPLSGFSDAVAIFGLQPVLFTMVSPYIIDFFILESESEEEEEGDPPTGPYGPFREMNVYFDEDIRSAPGRLQVNLFSEINESKTKVEEVSLDVQYIPDIPDYDIGRDRVSIQFDYVPDPSKVNGFGNYIFSRSNYPNTTIPKEMERLGLDTNCRRIMRTLKNAPAGSIFHKVLHGPQYTTMSYKEFFRVLITHNSNSRIEILEIARIQAMIDTICPGRLKDIGLFGKLRQLLE